MLEGSYADKATIIEGEKIIQHNWNHIDALINCAGVFAKTNPLEMEINQWRVTFDIMLNGCLLITQLAVKFMKQGGRIVHITSIHGTRAETHASSYSMARLPLINLPCNGVGAC